MIVSGGCHSILMKPTTTSAMMPYVSHRICASNTSIIASVQAQDQRSLGVETKAIYNTSKMAIGATHDLRGGHLRLKTLKNCTEGQVEKALAKMKKHRIVIMLPFTC